MKLNPYLAFKGNCEEAMNFYKENLQGTIESVQYFKDGDMDVPENMKDQVMHLEMHFGGNILMASDGFEGEIANSNITLAIAMEDVSEMEQVFHKMAEGGKITMPLENTFWGARFGMLTDKFGTKWMFNCELKK
ncbi:VOC family protein [Fulvivirgaceae bacterium BMA10]|uniref:VOC family protein n=1 Tax=Splendidivirga corallicola TaxID=3051826 RepID=A0ABT8KYV4_9BACT|nr:VOC family protein [Fulvivirgaceae bacterium BMA10]